MISRIHEKLGTAGFLISIVALVVALTGGAYAASGGLNGKQKKEVEKIAKKFAGAPGAPGTPGAAGSKGDNGAAGSNGTNGTNGANGTSVTTTAIPTSSATCGHNGGVEVKSASPTQNVCNGTTGFAESLPSEKTETGTWSYGPVPTGANHVRFQVSFPTPLATGVHVAVHYIKLVETEPGSEEFELGHPTAECPGTAAHPEAVPGNLCLYAAIGTEEPGATTLSSIDPISGEGGKAGAVGAAVTFFGNTAGSQGFGDWAVTAP